MSGLLLVAGPMHEQCQLGAVVEVQVMGVLCLGQTAKVVVAGSGGAIELIVLEV